MPDTRPPAVRRAPHRLAFLLGMLSTLLLFAAWFAELASRLGSHPIAPAVPAVMAHGFLMLYGIFPLFMTGFMVAAQTAFLRGDDLTQFIRKPIVSEELLAVIEGLLALCESRLADAAD